VNPLRILVATTLAADPPLLSAGVASAATPAAEPMPGQHVSDSAGARAFSRTHNPAIMRQGMSGMDMTMTTSPTRKRRIASKLVEMRASGDGPKLGHG
jgi:hypothetical protein